jgi:hypothetical protein
VAKISPQELAGRVPCPLEEVRRLEDLGLLEPSSRSRMTPKARPNEVLVSEAARRNAGVADVEFELVGEVPLQGVAKPVRLHRASRG